MRIRTVHQAVSVTVNQETGETCLVEFAPTADPMVFEGEVDDEIGNRLLGIRRSPQEYCLVDAAPPVEEHTEGAPPADEEVLTRTLSTEEQPAVPDVPHEEVSTEEEQRDAGRRGRRR